MKTSRASLSDFMMSILLAWFILCSAAIVVVDQYTYLLAISLLVMIVSITSMRIHRMAPIATLVVGIGVYLVVFFSITPFSLKAVLTPALVVCIFCLSTLGMWYVLARTDSEVDLLLKEKLILSDLIQYDAATGMLIWKHAVKKLEAEIIRSRRYQSACGLVMFEPVLSDGVPMDEQKLRELHQSIARVVNQTCRIHVDIPFTGRHFGVILPETNLKGTRVFANRLLDNAARYAFLNLRIAVVTFPDHGVTVEDLVARCDDALAEALKEDKSIVCPEIPQIETQPASDAKAEGAAIPVPVRDQPQLATLEQELEDHEYILTFDDFYEMADLPLIQKTLMSFGDIDQVALLNYSDGELSFKIRSQKDYSRPQIVHKIRKQLKANWIRENHQEG